MEISIDSMVEILSYLSPRIGVSKIGDCNIQDYDFSYYDINLSDCNQIIDKYIKYLNVL